jgi:Phage tail assembly chaperone
MNIRDLILNSNDRKTEKVETPEWGCEHVYVRTLSHSERRRLRSVTTTASDDDLYLAKLAASVICDEQGNRIFTDDDAKLVAEKSGPVLDRVVGVWMKLNAVDPATIKDMEKNS